MTRLELGDWLTPFEADGGPSLITGAPAPLPLGNFRVHADPFAAPPDDDPVTKADTTRANAQRGLDLMQTTTAANRELDTLMAAIIEVPDWRDGLTKFDKGYTELKHNHLRRFTHAEDGAAFSRDLDEAATIRRIDLKRALAERQQAEALSGLEDTLAYYVQQAATARHDLFRDIAIERGLAAIDRMATAGYLFPETAGTLAADFRARIDAADLEAIVRADPDEAPAILASPDLFPNVDAATRENLRRQLDGQYDPATGVRKAIRLYDEPASELRTIDRDGPRAKLVPFDMSAAGRSESQGSESAGHNNIDGIAEALAPLTEKNDGLRELLDGAKATPDDLGALIRLATELAEIGPTLPEANVGKLLEGILRLLGPLGRLLRRDQPNERLPQLPPPKPRGEEPTTPPSAAPSPISPPRAKPPHVPPPEGEGDRPQSAQTEKPPSALSLARDIFEDAVEVTDTRSTRRRSDISTMSTWGPTRRTGGMSR